jgi:hypothetical protein
MEQIFKQLVLMLQTDCANLNMLPELDGLLRKDESIVNLLYNLATNDLSLLKLDIDGLPVKHYLCAYAKCYVEDEWNDYCTDNNVEMSYDDYLTNEWLTNDDSEQNYYYSNGAYQMWGVTAILLRNMINNC